MIDDMALLKQEMELMDAEDPVVAQAAKDRAAQTLGNAKLSFSKIADLIEQRRLLLRPRILTNIKRMDQPGMLGDAAFRDAGSALRREGQSFRQIAAAIELNGRPGPRDEEPLQKSELLYPVEMEREPGVPGWLRAVNLVARIVFSPLRHPIRFLTIALLVRQHRRLMGDFAILTGWSAPLALLAWWYGPWSRPPIVLYWIILSCGLFYWAAYRVWRVRPNWRRRGLLLQFFTLGANNTVTGSHAYTSGSLSHVTVEND